MSVIFFCIKYDREFPRWIVILFSEFWLFGAGMQIFDKSLFAYVKFTEAFDFKIRYGIPLAIPFWKKKREEKKRRNEKKREKKFKEID